MYLYQRRFLGWSVDWNFCFFLLYVSELFPFTLRERSVCKFRPLQSISVPSSECLLTCRRVFAQASKLKRYRCWRVRDAPGIMGFRIQAGNRLLCSSFCSSRCNTCKSRSWSWVLHVNKTFLVLPLLLAFEQTTELSAFPHAAATLLFFGSLPGFGQQRLLKYNYKWYIFFLNNNAYNIFNPHVSKCLLESM